ncbi:heavy metal translocating P-type ATPase [Luteococcus sp. Sow4_B9]|uniref:heavy metal translocating P-type ATPase n=1 Tax=Luteococcus sp. Sow4_B9 TaxID=3438792 RepID=UPI003F9B55D4
MTPAQPTTGSRLRRSPWTIPALAAALVIASWAAGWAGRDGIADALMLTAAVVAGHRIALNAVRALTNRVIGIDLLVTIAAVGAILVRNFWEAAAVTTLFAIGGALEAMTLNRTRSALSDLVESAPDMALVVRDGVEVEVPAHHVRDGETVIVKSGGIIPVDGRVTSGSAAVNEASITGESIPVEKSADGEVYAGTVLTGGHLRVTATSIGAETTLARIIRRVEDAQDAKARTQTFMERFSRWYTPGIVLMALVTGLVTRNVELALTLLVIGCPGALVISIPVAIVAGVGRGARDGILIKGGEHLERAATVDVVALDKTGTLTRGLPELTDVIPLADGMTRPEVLRLAAMAESGSEHPLARPIVEAARDEGLLPASPNGDFRPVVGHGIVATIDGSTIAVGKPELVEQAFPGRDGSGAQRVIDDLGAQGRTAMAVARDGELIGVVAVADTLRPEAAQVVEDLHRIGVERVLMLTGDRQSVAAAVAHQAGIDEVHAGLLPEQKLEIITGLQRDGHRVAMVGDGVNDAPALASADTGIAMGAAGSGLAVETADIALMADRIDRVADALGLARSTLRVMRQNIVIALVTVAALLAGVFAGGVTMSLGMLVHEASVLVVIFNAMRLLRRRT